MSLSVRMVVVLTAVGLISGGLLSVVNLLTAERIELNRQREIEEAITRVVPGTVSSATLYEEDKFTVYVGRDAADQELGYAIYASGTGFQDVIVLMFGTDPAIEKIFFMTILEQKETPGLGAKITDQEGYLRFWQDKDIQQPLTLRKPAVGSPEELGSSEVNAITGATISSDKVLGIVNLSLERLRQIKQEGKLGSGDGNGN
ncbi:MAG: FMN-binding protein [Candidatus Aminicenantaceae bacterium]|jgi:RnfABCDGE-type electron transport complex G subunit